MDSGESRDSAPNSPESAADYVRRSSAAIRASCPGLRIWEAQRRAILDWAEVHGRNLPIDYVDRFSKIGEGAEHVVFHDSERHVAVKATKPNHYGHPISGPGLKTLPIEYLERLACQNEIFGDGILIEGIAYDGEQLEVVTTQPWITAHPTMPNPLQEEIEEYLLSFSFIPIEWNESASLFFSDSLGLLVSDAHNENILRDENGKLSPIDLVIGIPGPDLLMEIRRKISAALD